MIDVAFLSKVLRAPGEAAAQCREEVDPRAIARTALITLAVAAIAFGAIVGTWHGGRQIAYAATKMPIGILGTLVLAAPAFYALAAVFGRAWPLRSVFSLVLAAGARFAMVLLSMTPVLWLTINFGAPYSAITLAATAVYGLAGLAGLEVLIRGLGSGAGQRMIIGLFIGIFLLVGAQNAWVLRPYVVAPGSGELPMFTQEREGGLAVQLYRTVRRMVGP